MLVDDPRIAIHYVGARSGGPLFMALPTLERTYTCVWYDADADSLDEVALHKRPGDIVLPYCLGATDGPATLHITYCPYKSSVYPMTERREDVFSFTDGYDYRTLATGITMEDRVVHQHRLDAIPEIRDGRVPPPSIINLDTQGSECDILRGAAQTIADHTLAVRTEVEFVESYAGQATFGDIAAFLDDAGFALVGFTNMEQGYLCRQPLGVRGVGFMIAGDVLFLRRIASVAERPDLLLKLGLIALAGGHFEYAFEAWSAMPREVLNRPAYVDGEYTALVRDLLDAYERTPRLFPKEFGDFYSWELSRERSRPGGALVVQQALARIREELGEAVLAEHRAELRRLCSPEELPIEAALRRHGLTDLAGHLKARRTSDVAQFMASIGFAVVAPPAAAGTPSAPA